MSLGSLKRKTAEISVLVDGKERRFLLSAKPILEQLEMMMDQAVGKSIALDYMTQALDSSSPVLAIKSAHADYLAKSGTVVQLLSKPLDGGSPLTVDEFWLLETGDPDRVIAEQEALTAMEKALGNGEALADQARALKRSRQAGSLSGQP